MSKLFRYKESEATRKKKKKRTQDGENSATTANVETHEERVVSDLTCT